MKNLSFTQEFSSTFKWKDNYHLKVGSIRPENKKQIAEGLKDMSPESIRNRFLGSKRAFTERELQYLTDLDGLNHYAIGVQELKDHERGVAIIRLVRSSHSETEGEVAITIIDDYQKIGLGAFLLDLIVLAAIERAFRKLSFTFLPQNSAIPRLLNKIATPVPGVQTKDFVQLFLDLSLIDEAAIRERVSKVLPEIKTIR